MSDFDPFDETDLLRLDLADLGFATLPEPADLGVPLRPASSFFTSEADASAEVVDEAPLASVTPFAAKKKAPETVAAAAPRRGAARPGAPRRSAADRAAKRRWPLAAAAVAAAAAVTTAAVVLPQRLSSQDPTAGGHTHPTSSASPRPATPVFTDVAQVIQAAASGAGAEATETDVMEYWRIDSRIQEGDGEPMTRKVWLGRTQKGLLIEDGEELTLPPATFGILTTEWTFDELQELTGNPKKLRKLFMDEIRRQQSGPASKHDWTLVNIFGNLLSEAPLPPHVRQAMWQVLLDIPSITLIGRQSDALEREGQALSLAGPSGETFVWIIDVVSGSLLEISNMTEDPSDLVMRTTFIQHGPTDRLPALI